MNKLSNAKRTQVVAALVEGNSIRATVRMTGVAKNTVVKLLVELGAACEKYQRETLVDLRSCRIQCDGNLVLRVREGEERHAGDGGQSRHGR